SASSAPRLSTESSVKICFRGGLELVVSQESTMTTQDIREALSSLGIPADGSREADKVASPPSGVLNCYGHLLRPDGSRVRCFPCRTTRVKCTVTAPLIVLQRQSRSLICRICGWIGHRCRRGIIMRMCETEKHDRGETYYCIGPFATPATWCREASNRQVRTLQKRYKKASVQARFLQQLHTQTPLATPTLPHPTHPHPTTSMDSFAAIVSYFISAPAQEEPVANVPVDAESGSGGGSTGCVVV
ncbi:hypothetical protein OF83DRAFT_1183108, partial [Amylostereum chailletii]